MADRNPTDFQEPAGDQPARGLPDEGPKRRPTGALIAAALLGIVIIAVIFVVAFSDDDDDDLAAAVNPQDPVLEGAITAQEAVERFDELEGQEVTIGATVGTGLALHMATLGGDADGPEQLLMVGEHPEIGAFPQAVRARVTGTLVSFDPDQAEQQLGIELDRDLTGNYEGEPAILASSIHYYFLATGTGPSGLDLIGQQVTVQSAEVESVLGDGLVRVAGGQLLIANAGQAAEGDFLEATGTMAVVDADLLGGEHPQVAAMIAELDEDERSGLMGLPLLVADEVEVIEAPTGD